MRISTSATNFRALLPRFLAGLLWGWVVWWGGISCGWGQLAPASAPLKIAYLAELPVSWRTGLADPQRNIARSPGTGFARPIDLEIPLSADHVFGVESRDELSRPIQLGAADWFPIQAYQWVEHSRLLKFKPLRTATRHGRWQTRFLLLAAKGSKIRSPHDLKDRTILIHRDGCGNLVGYWLDAASAVGTGTPRKIFARYQTVTQAWEAVRPVFFSEADAGVVWDDGVGIDSSFDITKATSPGKCLVKQQIDHLNGKLAFDGAQGTRIEIHFKESQSKIRLQPLPRPVLSRLSPNRQSLIPTCP